MSRRVLSLFSGVGLHDLGLQRAGWEIAAQCEVDPWCRAVLAKNFPGVPCFNDVRDIGKEATPGIPGPAATIPLCGIDLVTGGFP